MAGALRGVLGHDHSDWTCIYSSPLVYPEEVVKYPNHSAETFNTTWLTRDVGTTVSPSQNEEEVRWLFLQARTLTGLVQLEEELGCAEQ